jgi:hypothetical protein
MPSYTVRCVEITKVQGLKRKTSFADKSLRGLPTESRAKAQTNSLVNNRPSVRPRAFGPLAIVTLVDFGIAITLFVSSIVYGDGMSMLATILLALLSTLTGVSNSWNLRLPRRSPSDAPAGDTVIRYPNGSFLVVKCEEDIARELFFAPEEIDYTIKNTIIYRLISLVGTLMLMLGVIALANARLELQFAWAGAYIIINAAHWVAAAVPAHSHWDFDDYRIEEIGLQGGFRNVNFTEALWKAILFTQSKRWVQLGGAAPKAPWWDEWLEEAKAHADLRIEITGDPEDPLWPASGTGRKLNLYGTPHKWDAKPEYDRIYERFKNQGLTV